MASPSQPGATRAPPLPDQLAAFYKLVDKKVIAAALCRYARHAELSASAAVQAEALFGADNSLVVADLRMNESAALTTLAAEASGAEQEAFIRRGWAALLSVIPLLLRRIEASTLLPGTIREEEVDYTAYMQAATRKAVNKPVASPAELRTAVSAMGYNTLMYAMDRSLDLLALPFWPAAQKKMVESFVLQGLDVIPQTAGIPAQLVPVEIRLVKFVEENMNPRDYEPTFHASVIRKWRSNAVSRVLRARDVLQTGIAEYKQRTGEFEARKRADVTKHGLRDCALPSCSKTEKTVKEFAGCSGCRSVVYCCLEHQALDWRAHKKACREKEAARLAAEEAVEETAGGAAAG